MEGVNSGVVCVHGRYSLYTIVLLCAQTMMQCRTSTSPRHRHARVCNQALKVECHRWCGEPAFLNIQLPVACMHATDRAGVCSPLLNHPTNHSFSSITVAVALKAVYRTVSQQLLYLSIQTPNATNAFSPRGHHACFLILQK